MSRNTEIDSMAKVVGITFFWWSVLISGMTLTASGVL